MAIHIDENAPLFPLSPQESKEGVIGNAYFGRRDLRGEAGYRPDARAHIGLNLELRLGRKGDGELVHSLITGRRIEELMDDFDALEPHQLVGKPVMLHYYGKEYGGISKLVANEP